MNANSNELHGVVSDIEAVALRAAKDQPPEISARVLAFLTKVAHVVDQAYRDVLALLIDLRFIGDDALATGEIQDLRRRVALVLETSRYRDAEEICSRLKSLKETYLADLQQYVDPYQRNQWTGLFGLIEEREGRIVSMIQSQLYELDRALQHADTPADLERLRRMASSKTGSIKADLSDLNTFTNQILGLGGDPGLLEMLRDERTQSTVVKQISVMVDKRQEHKYGGDHSVIIGASATTGDIHNIHRQKTSDVDLVQLAKELSALRHAMRAAASGDPEEDVAIGAVAKAETEAKAGNGPAAVTSLKNAGRWALGVAEKIGVGVAIGVLKPIVCAP